MVIGGVPSSAVNSSFFCQSCKKNFARVQPDGSCPDCYSAAGIRQILAENRQSTTSHPLSMDIKRPGIRLPASVHPLASDQKEPVPEYVPRNKRAAEKGIFMSTNPTGPVPTYRPKAPSRATCSLAITPPAPSRMISSASPASSATKSYENASVQCGPETMDQSVQWDSDQSMQCIPSDVCTQTEPSPRSAVSGTRCIFCEDNQLNVLFRPCKHASYCEECAVGTLKCPMCNEPVESFEVIFVTGAP